MTQAIPEEPADRAPFAASSPGPGIDSVETETERALKALKDRPKFTVRMQVYLAVILSLAMFIGIAGALLITTYMIERKVRFLEISNSYLFELQQARRFEKNFFLYGTSLTDALDNVRIAKRILLKNSEGLEAVMGKDSFALILPRLNKYEKTLEELEDIVNNPVAEDYILKKSDVEAQVRKNGQEVISLAQDLMEREKKALDRMIVLSRKVHIYSFLFLFFFFAFNTYFLGRRMLSPLRRFVAYSERIATGDYSPIMPARRYRDEFSNLAVAVNKMIREIEVKQDQLIQSHKVTAIGLLTSGVAHELNNPLNNINITVEYILENFDDLPNDEKKELLNDIMRQGERATSTVKELLHFTRARPDALEELDIGALIDDTLRLLQNQLNLNGIVLEKEYPEVVPSVTGNRNNLQQVFLNIFLNAIQGMPDGGTLRTVVTDTHVGLLQIDITDNGAGIKPEYLQKIFDPYFTTKDMGEGTGLGLAVCFGIVKKHGGKILVSSELGIGSTFSVYLPCSTREIVRTEKAVSRIDEEAAGAEEEHHSIEASTKTEGE